MTPSPMPDDLARDRGQVLHRALRDLPVGLLAPLLRGVRRHADLLVPGSLYSDEGACAVGLMLDELRGPRRRGRFRWSSPTIHEEEPEMARDYPRLAHIEFIFDRTCKELQHRLGLAPDEAGHTTGLWMAAEVQAEINLRHMEAGAEGRPSREAQLDPAVFADTVARLRDLRPWLSEGQAARTVEGFVGARRAESLFVPAEWEAELELQRRRLAWPA
jgi:hypothetical protein